MPQSNNKIAAGTDEPTSAAPPPPSSKEEDCEFPSYTRQLRSCRKRTAHGALGASAQAAQDDYISIILQEQRALLARVGEQTSGLEAPPGAGVDSSAQPPSCQEGTVRVYARGTSFLQKERGEVDDLVDRFHSDRKVQELCCMIRQTAAELLEEDTTENIGRGYIARRDIPVGALIALYTGNLEKVAPAVSRHIVRIGLTELGFALVVDGTLPPGKSLPLGSLQLVNHSCSPNCITESIETESTLELVVLRSTRVIKAGESISFSYGGSFWRPARTLELQQRPRGFHLIRCKCAKRCPNDFARFERASPSRAGPIRSARAALTEQDDQARSTSALEN